jgi:hypothetical protein
MRHGGGIVASGSGLGQSADVTFDTVESMNKHTARNGRLDIQRRCSAMMDCHRTIGSAKYVHGRLGIDSPIPGQITRHHVTLLIGLDHDPSLGALQ